VLLDKRTAKVWGVGEKATPVQLNASQRVGTRAGQTIKTKTEKGRRETSKDFLGQRRSNQPGKNVHLSAIKPRTCAVGSSGGGKKKLVQTDIYQDEGGNWPE